MLARDTAVLRYNIWSIGLRWGYGRANGFYLQAGETRMKIRLPNRNAQPETLGRVASTLTASPIVSPKIKSLIDLRFCETTI